MTKKDEPVQITLTIPTDGSGVASMAARKGDVGKIKQVTFGDQNDLAAAIYETVYELMEMEVNPPPSYDASPQPAPAQSEQPANSEAAPEGAPTPEQGDEEEIEEEAEPGQELEEPGEVIDEPVYQDLSDDEYPQDAQADSDDDYRPALLD